MNRFYDDECYFYYTAFNLTLLGSSLVMTYFAFSEFSFQTFLYRYLGRLERNEIREQLEEIKQHLKHLKESSMGVVEDDAVDNASSKSLYSEQRESPVEEQVPNQEPDTCGEPEVPKKKSGWSRLF